MKNDVLQSHHGHRVIVFRHWYQDSSSQQSYYIQYAISIFDNKTSHDAAGADDGGMDDDPCLYFLIFQRQRQVQQAWWENGGVRRAAGVAISN